MFSRFPHDFCLLSKLYAVFVLTASQSTSSARSHFTISRNFVSFFLLTPARLSRDFEKMTILTLIFFRNSSFSASSFNLTRPRTPPTRNWAPPLCFSPQITPWRSFSRVIFARVIRKSKNTNIHTLNRKNVF